MQVVVLGAGIAGLSCALRLREAGCSVTVVAGEQPEQTTSAVAAALWYPYRAYPEREVTRWGAATYSELAGLADDPATGVRLRAGRELFCEPTADPWWRSAVPGLERLPAAALPAGYVDGFALTVPIVDSSVHLPWLLERNLELGVSFRWEWASDLAALAPDADVIVNCAGLGAQRLIGDDSMVAVRGQIVVVEQVGLTEWLVDDSGPEAPVYVVPRERTIVLGGTAEIGASSVDPDPATAVSVRAKCAALVPELARATVLAHRVGLRPTRPAVRLEADHLSTGQPVVHNYGHGGAGWTLGYGCAADVVELVLA